MRREKETEKRTGILLTPDLIIDLYEQAKLLPEKEKAEALQKIGFLSQHLYKEAHLVDKDREKKSE